MCDTLDMNTHIPKPVKEEKEPEKVEQKEEEKKEEDKEKVWKWHYIQLETLCLMMPLSFFAKSGRGWKGEGEGSRRKKTGDGSGWETQGNQVKKKEKI